jgi:hypothetical protein
MNDIPGTGTKKGCFEGYSLSGFNNAADTAVLDDYVVVKKAQIKNYKGNTPENGNNASVGKANILDLPKILDVKAPEKTITEAVALASDDAKLYDKKTKLYYTVKGFVKELTMDDDEPTKVKSFTMAETADGEAGFTAYRCRTEDGVEVNVGDEVTVRGAIKKYTAQGADPVYEVEYGRIVIVNSTALPEALIERSHKQVIKTVEDGQIVIIKNGVRYNLLGGAIR